MTNIQTIALASIRIDGNTQSRVSINDATVGEYAEALSEGATLPAIVVFHDGAAYWVADGFHRLLANTRIGAVTMDADVRAGSLTDAQLYAFGANQSHGLRRTNEDKRKSVLGVLALRPDWSDRAIAKHVGVSNNFVSVLRRSLSSDDSEESGERTYTTKHGTTATMDTSGQKEAGKAKKAKPEGTSTATETAASSTAEQRAPGPVVEVEDVEDVDAGPSAEEVAEARRAAEDDAEAVRVLLESDDKLAAMTEKCKQQAALIRTLEERIRGLTNESAQAIRLAKSWRTKFEKLERATA